MLYKILKVENKGPDWKVVDAVGVDGIVIENASVNRVDRKTNAPFPGFDNIIEGGQLEANHWRSQEGKNYFFPPRPKPAGGSRGGFNATAAIAQKNDNINKVVDRKEDGIKTSSTARDATLILSTIYNTLTPQEQVDWQGKWLEIREWLFNNWDRPSSEIPF